jgi:histidine ammonia-lyase
MQEISRLEETMQDEANAVTDNPIVIPAKNKIVSGGNFHGEKLAFALDFAAIALAELGSISERRTYLLLRGQRGLLPFLIQDAGLNSGFMIPQYTSAALASMNKQLCTPASVDSIPSSNGQEDHVSMGANAANKALKVLANVERIISIELFTAAQAMEFRRPLKSSPALEQMLAMLRKQIPFLKKDRLMKKEMEKALDFLHSYFSN